MGMLCFKNGSLTRQNVRDQSVGKSWDAFDDALKRTNPGNGGRLGFYFDLKEIIPDGVEGTFRFVRGEDGSWKRVESFEADDGSADVRAVVEGQFLSMRSRTAALLPHQGGKPRRIIATGGTSSNRSVLQILADVMDADVYCYTSTAGATIGGAVLGMMAYRQSQGGAREDAADVVDDAAEERGLKLMVRPNAEAVKVYDALLPQWEKAEALVVEACR
jgi:xylulokinase